jgi:hypothetical protein
MSASSFYRKAQPNLSGRLDGMEHTAKGEICRPVTPLPAFACCDELAERRLMHYR